MVSKLSWGSQGSSSLFLLSGWGSVCLLYWVRAGLRLRQAQEGPGRWEALGLGVG